LNRARISASCIVDIWANGDTTGERGIAVRDDGALARALIVTSASVVM